ncbi:MAG: SirB2 family protein [Massilia sp.]
MSLAALSGGFFLLRGAWMLGASAMLRRGWVKRLPHRVDSLLLASAITLAVWSGQSPFEQPWLGAKITALIAYILFGTLALKRGRTRAVRGAAFAAALLCYGYIVTVAVTKNPLFFL